MGAIHSDISSVINAFIRKSGGAASVLSRQFDLPILTDHVENALVEALNLESSIQLLDSHWTSNDILSALRGFNFHRLFPVFLIQITLDTSIIPQGALRSLVEQTVKCKGEIWRTTAMMRTRFHQIHTRTILPRGTSCIWAQASCS